MRTCVLELVPARATVERQVHDVVTPQRVKRKKRAQAGSETRGRVDPHAESELRLAKPAQALSSNSFSFDIDTYFRTHRWLSALIEIYPWDPSSSSVFSAEHVATNMRAAVACRRRRRPCIFRRGWNCVWLDVDLLRGWTYCDDYYATRPRTIVLKN